MTELDRAAFPLELRVADLEERTLEGVVVPYGETTFLTSDPAGERFVAGSLTRTVTERGANVKLFRAHDHSHAIGKAVGWDPDHKRGLWGTFRMAATPAGNDALLELREGVLDAFSIGFRAVRARRGRDGAREIEEAALHEVSVAPMGAYDGARVLALRTPAAPVLPPMPAVNLEPVPPLR